MHWVGFFPLGGCWRWLSPWPVQFYTPCLCSWLFLSKHSASHSSFFNHTLFFSDHFSSLTRSFCILTLSSTCLKPVPAGSWIHFYRHPFQSIIQVHAGCTEWGKILLLQILLCRKSMFDSEYCRLCLRGILHLPHNIFIYRDRVWWFVQMKAKSPTAYEILIAPPYL